MRASLDRMRAWAEKSDMNRIQLCDALPSESLQQKQSDNRLQQLPLVDAPAQNVEHSVFVPLHYEANYSYPLIVWLHGPRDDQSQLKKIMPLISLRNFIGIAPCGTVLEAGERSSSSYLGYGWQQKAQDIASCEERVMRCVNVASSRFKINQARIFIGGYDSGGTMALRIASLHPELFAGVASIGGQFPQGLNPLQRLGMVRNLPVLLMHGRDSDEYQLSTACDDLRLMHSAGMSVSLRQYPCEQEVTTVMLEDLNRWLMDIVTGAPAEEPPTNWQASNDQFLN